MPQKQAAVRAPPVGLQLHQYGRRNRSLAWLISGAAARVDAIRYSLSWEEEGSWRVLWQEISNKSPSEAMLVGWGRATDVIVLRSIRATLAEIVPKRRYSLFKKSPLRKSVALG